MTTPAWERWLYNGLHSLDFAWMISRRPLWDIVLIVLSLGGLASSAIGLLLGWRRIRSIFVGGQPSHGLRESLQCCPLDTRMLPEPRTTI